MVLGPDGKPCRACTAFKEFANNQGVKKAMSNTGMFCQSVPKRTNADLNREIAAKQAAKAGSATTAIGALATLPPQCPPDSEQLGRSTWTFLHTVAAYYPVNPTPQHRRSMLSLLQSLPVLYPCNYCADHLGVEMQKNPPDVSGRAQLSNWLCDVHNEVNERLGKDKFDCARAIERWKDGPKDGSCD